MADVDPHDYHPTIISFRPLGQAPTMGDNRNPEERVEEYHTLLALDEAYREMMRGEGRRLRETLPAMRIRCDRLKDQYRRQSQL